MGIGQRVQTLFCWFSCMSSGLQIFNSSGNVQIDSGFRNYGIASVHQGSGLQPGFWSNPQISFPAISSPPMLFMRTITANYISFNNWIRSGTNYVGAKLHVFGSGSFEVFVASPTPGASGSYGLQVFDANGDAVFDSNKRYVKLIDALFIGQPDGFGGMTYPGGSFDSYQHANPGGQTPFYCLGGGNGHIEDGLVGEQGVAPYSAAACIRSNGPSSVFFGYRLIERVNPGGATTFPNASASYANTGSDWIYRAPIAVGVMSN